MARSPKQEIKEFILFILSKSSRLVFAGLPVCGLKIGRSRFRRRGFAPGNSIWSDIYLRTKKPIKQPPSKNSVVRLLLARAHGCIPDCGWIRRWRAPFAIVACISAGAPRRFTPARFSFFFSHAQNESLPIDFQFPANILDSVDAVILVHVRSGSRRSRR
jgi:hypothetical protein